MKTSLAYGLVISGVMLAGLGFLVHWLAADSARLTLITALAGGLLGAILGVLALAGCRVRAWAILSLAAVAFILLSQAVTAWMAPAAGLAQPVLVAALLTLMLVIAVGTIMMLAYAQPGTRIKS